MKSELFFEVLEIVSKEMEVTQEAILSKSKEMEVVDARTVIVGVLHGYGLYPGQIASLMNKTPASIRYLITNFEARKKGHKMIEITLENVRKRIVEK